MPGKKLSMFQIILLVSFGGLAIAGILIFAFAVGGGGSTSLGSVTIWGTLDQTAFTTVLRQASDNDPKLSGVTYVKKDEATYASELTNALASGTGPDLFLMRQDRAVVDAGKVAAIPYDLISRQQFEGTFVDAAAPYLAQNGIVGFPILVDPMVLYWNKDMLATAGYSQPPQNWGQLFSMAQKLTKRDESGSILKSAIAFGEYRNIPNAKDIVAMLISQAGGAPTTYDSSGRIVSTLVPKIAGAARSTEDALRFYTEFADPSKSDYSWNRSLPNAQDAFASGDLALYVGYASEESLIARKNPNLSFAVAPMPQTVNAPRAVTGGRVYALAASRSGANPSAAITAASLIASSEVAGGLSVALGIPSARRDVLAVGATGNDDLYNRMAIIARTWFDPDPSQTDDIFRAMIEDTTSGAMLLSQAVQRADQQMGRLLGL